jgi:uncharacterized protein (DUF924 family)
LEAEVDLHDVLYGFVRLRYEHIEEEDSQESTTLLIGQLESSLLGRKSELKDWLQHERRHQVVEKFPRLVHLVASTHYRCQNLEDLFRHEVIIGVLFQAVDTMLEDFLSECFKFLWV